MVDPSKELLKKALFILVNDYDLDEDSFFLVMTKDGKNPTLDVSDQTIVGELNVKTLVAFIIQAINQVCSSVGMNPHVFISRYITGAVLEQDRLRLFDLLGGQSFSDVDEDDYDEDEEYIFDEDDLGGDEEEEIVYVLNSDWDKIKN